MKSAREIYKGSREDTAEIQNVLKIRPDKPLAAEEAAAFPEDKKVSFWCFWVLLRPVPQVGCYFLVCGT